MRTRHWMLSAVIVALLVMASVGLAAGFQDDFDPGIDGSLWAQISGGTADTQPCGSVSGNALQMIGAGARVAETVVMDLSGVDSFSFALRLGNDEGDCEEVNGEDNEFVYLEYSVDGGAWQLWGVFDVPDAPTFTTFTYPVPPEAEDGAIAFRWLQYEHSANDGEACCDFWALDNVVFIPGSGSDDGVVVGPPCDNLFDGRINDNQALDCAAPVAIYVIDGRIDVYAVHPDSGDGALSISAGAPGEDAVPEASGNILLGSATNPFTGALIRLYWLPATSEYLLLTTYADGKAYEVVWSTADDLRHITA